MPKLTDAQRRILAHIGTEWATYATICQAAGETRNICPTLGALERAGVIERRTFGGSDGGPCRAPEWRRVDTAGGPDKGNPDSMAARVRNRPEPESTPALPGAFTRDSMREDDAPKRDESAPAPVINPADVVGFREFWNDYLTPGKFAADKGISHPDATALIARGRAAHDYGAPLARALKALNSDVVLAGGELTTTGGPVGLLYRPTGFRPAGSRPIYRESTFATRWIVDGTPYGQEYPADAAGAYLAAYDYVKRTADSWAPGDKAARTFAGIGFGRMSWVEYAPDTRPGMDTREARGVEPGETGRPAHLVIGERPDAGLLVTLAFEGDSVRRVDIRPDEYRPTMPPRYIARNNPDA